MYAVSAVKKIFTYLPRVYADGSDKEAREAMSAAAYEAGICINNSSVTIVHGMSRPIGALFHVPHGLSNAMLLKVCLEFAADGTYERFAALGRAVGRAESSDSDETAAKNLLRLWEKSVKSAKCRHWKNMVLTEKNFSKLSERWRRMPMTAEAQAIQEKQLLLKIWK